MSRRTLKIISIAAGVIVALAALYIMGRGLGLVPGFDFGAGAYYYADIPEFDKFSTGSAEGRSWAVSQFADGLPVWVYIALFLGWGWLMYRLWKKIG